MHIKFKDQNFKSSKNLTRKGFTLMEIVIVMGIIAVLLGGVVAVLGNFGENSKIQKAQLDIQSGFTPALESYKILAKKYPTTQQGLEALVNKPTLPPIPKHYSPPLTSLPVDPWGNDYIYESNGYKYTIISKGSDGAIRTEDDIKSNEL